MKKILFLLTLVMLSFSYKAQACHYTDATQVGTTINNGNGTYTFTVEICQGYGIEGSAPNGSDINGNGSIALAGIDDTDGFRVVLTGATFTASGFPSSVTTPDLVNGNNVSGALSGSSTVLYTGTGIFIDLQAVSCVDNTCTQAGANSLCWNMTFTTTGLPSNVQINGIEDNTTSGSGTQSCPLSFRPIAPCPIYTLNPPTAVCSGSTINFPFTGSCSGLDATASSGPVIDIFYYNPAGSGGTIAPVGYESTIDVSAPTETFESAANNPQGIDDKDPNLTAADWDISCASPGSFTGFTNETCQPITVTFFAVVFDYSIDSDGDTRAEYNPNCTIQRYDVTIYPAPFTAVPVVGACDQAASIELRAADGSICDSQTGITPVRPACTSPAGAANDNQPLSYSWDANAIATIMGVTPAQIPACFTSTSFSGTVTADCASLGCPAPTCPTYGAPIHSGMACSGQQYSVQIPNTDCPALANFTITFDPGSLYNYEFAWELINNATNTVVVSGGNQVVLSSGGPGAAGGNNVASSGDPGAYPNAQGTVTINVPVDPDVDGQSFTIYLYDDASDGWQGSGGFFTITSDNPAATVLYNLVDASAGFDNTNLGFTTPLYNASDISIEYFSEGASLGSFAYGPCADATSFITLTNPNFCSTIVKTVTYELTCDDTGEVIQAGTFDVTVYPSLPTSAADLATITIDPLTCSPIITPKNDCDAADVGSTFTVTLAPPPTPTMGTNGTAVYNVVYNGISGGPNCCATGGPSIPFVFTTGDPTSTAVIGPFNPGTGATEAAFVTTSASSDPNSVGAGNATSGSFQVVMTGYTFPNPPGTGTNTSYWVTIYVDGASVSDVQSINPGPASSTTTITLAQIAAAGVTFDENSVIEAWIYPNSFSASGENTAYVPGGPANDPAEWTATSVAITNVNFTYDKLIPTAADCDFTVNVPFNCPTCTASVVNPTGTSMVLCGEGGALTGTDAATTAAPADYTNLYLLVNNLGIIVSTASTPAALVAPANTPAATCAANTDDTYTVYALQYQNLQGIDITTGSTTLTSIADADGDLIDTSPTLSACMDLSAPGITVDVLAPMIVNTEVLACSGGTYSVNIEACGGSTTTFADLTAADVSTTLPGSETYGSWINIADNLYRTTISNIASDPSGATITVTVSSTGGIPVCTGTSTFALQECAATCPTATTVTDDTGTTCSGGTDDLSAWQTAVATANPTGLVYSSVTPVAGTTLPDNTLPSGTNTGCSFITQTVMAYVYCDVDASSTVNAGDTYTLVSTYALTVYPAAAGFTVNPVPGSCGVAASAQLRCGGNTIATESGTTPTCAAPSQPLSGSFTATEIATAIGGGATASCYTDLTYGPIAATCAATPTATVTTTGNICVTGTGTSTLDLSTLITAGDTGGTWSLVTANGATLSGTTLSAATALDGATVTVRYTIAATADCPANTYDAAIAVADCSVPFATVSADLTDPCFCITSPVLDADNAVTTVGVLGDAMTITTTPATTGVVWTLVPDANTTIVSGPTDNGDGTYSVKVSYNDTGAGWSVTATPDAANAGLGVQIGTGGTTCTYAVGSFPDPTATACSALTISGATPTGGTYNPTSIAAPAPGSAATTVALTYTYDAFPAVGTNPTCTLVLNATANIPACPVGCAASSTMQWIK